MSVYRFTSLMTVPFKSGVLVTKESVGRRHRMMAPPEAVKVVVAPLQNCELSGSFVKTTFIVDWKGIPLLLSCSFHIPESQGM